MEYKKHLFQQKLIQIKIMIHQLMLVVIFKFGEQTKRELLMIQMVIQLKLILLMDNNLHHQVLDTLILRQEYGDLKSMREHMVQMVFTQILMIILQQLQRLQVKIDLVMEMILHHLIFLYLLVLVMILHLTLHQIIFVHGMHNLEMQEIILSLQREIYSVMVQVVIII